MKENYIQNQFVPYEIALTLKEIGFDEPCFGYYEVSDKHKDGFKLRFIEHEDSNPSKQPLNKDCLAPIYQQVLKWFLEKKILIEVYPIDDWEHWTYRISGEDVLSSFYIMYQNTEDLTPKDNPYQKAILKTIELWKNNL